MKPDILIVGGDHCAVNPGWCHVDLPRTQRFWARGALATRPNFGVRALCAPCPFLPIVFSEQCSARTSWATETVTSLVGAEHSK